jgi:hypothetical protein
MQEIMVGGKDELDADSPGALEIDVDDVFDNSDEVSC